MHSPATHRPKVRLKHCRVGANPIIWSNDDFMELGGEIPLSRCLADMRDAGYAGAELGNKFPRTAEQLAAALGSYNLQLVSGWHSTHLASRPFVEEKAAFLRHLGLLEALGAGLAIVAECTRAVHGQREVALAHRPVLTSTEWSRMIDGFAELAEIGAGRGMRLAYHHHMGTVVQTAEDIEQLLSRVPALGLLYDPGHLAFAGVDPMETLRAHGSRIIHVHLKNVRPAVVERARRERWSFCRAVTEGVFTIPGDGTPGDGSIDFPQVFSRLEALDYRGWLVVEAEEDPAKAEPAEKALRARNYVREEAGI